MNNEIKQNLNYVKLKEIIPFYISDINDKFFISLNNHPNKTFSQKIFPLIKKNLKEDDLIKLNELDNLTRADKIKMMLNLALKKIISKTGSYEKDIFVILNKTKTNDFVYIDYMKNYDKSNFSDSNLSQIERRYNFHIDINPQSYLYQYIQQIQLSFYLDEDNKILSGGFSLNYVSEKDLSFNESVKKIYLKTLIRNFILKQLYPMSLNNILELVEDYKPSKKNIKTKKLIQNDLQFNNINMQMIKENWIKLIDRKYLNYAQVDEQQKKYYHEDLFFSIMTTTIIILSIYEELRIYFTNESPEILLKLLNLPQNIKEDPNQNPELDFYELSRFLISNYFSKKENIKYQNIKNIDDLIEATAFANASIRHESFGFPIPVYEFDDHLNRSLIATDSIFKDNDKLKILYLMTISPELFGMDEDNSYFIEYGQLINILRTNQFTSKSMPQFYEKIDTTHCELNYNFVTFLNEKAVLILTSESIDVYHDYLWAEIYTQSIDWIRKDIEFDFDNDLNPKKNSLLYREKINTLENLIFDWHDDFYGISQIKNIVYKIDKTQKLKASINLLIERIIEKDQIYKKDTERNILVFAFLIAVLIGFNNFFGMIYTVLAVGSDVHISPANITVIVISVILSLFLVGIMSKYLFEVYRNQKYVKKNKKNS